jgi:hypothetical protein
MEQVYELIQSYLAPALPVKSEALVSNVFPF